MTTWARLRAFVRSHAVALRVIGAWIAAGVTTIAAYGPDEMATWTSRRWVMGLACAFVPGLLLALRGGEPNPTAAQLSEAIRAEIAKRDEGNGK